MFGIPDLRVLIALGLAGFDIIKAEDTKTPQSHRSDGLDAKEVRPALSRRSAVVGIG
jgi:hypothetical protein